MSDAERIRELEHELEDHWKPIAGSLAKQLQETTTGRVPIQRFINGQTAPIAEQVPICGNPECICCHSGFEKANQLRELGDEMAAMLNRPGNEELGTAEARIRELEQELQAAREQLVGYASDTEALHVSDKAAKP
jgi:hypothetical protein